MYEAESVAMRRRRELGRGTVVIRQATRDIVRANVFDPTNHHSPLTKIISIIKAPMRRWTMVNVTHSNHHLQLPKQVALTFPVNMRQVRPRRRLTQPRTSRSS